MREIQSTSPLPGFIVFKLVCVIMNLGTNVCMLQDTSSCFVDYSRTDQSFDPDTGTELPYAVTPSIVSEKLGV